jgi:Putative Flp pilus-assembly TadE/G-like
MLTQDQEKERGQSIVIIAFIVVVLLALVAVVVDVGNAYAQRRVVQNAVDSAAMAGVTVLTEGLINGDPSGVYFGVTDDMVQQAIEDYAELNGLDPSDVAAWYIDGVGQHLRQVGTTPGSLVPRKLNDANGDLQDVEGVDVNGDLPFNTYFAHLIGFPTLTASAPAQAWVMKGACNGDNLFPIALSDSTFDDEQGNHHDPVQGDPVAGPFYELWDHDDKNAPGSFGWIYWSPNGHSTPPTSPDIAQGPTDNCLEANMHWTSRSGMWNVGDWVPSSTGTQGSSGIRDEMAARILEQDPDRGPEVVIPLYSDIRGGGNNTEYEIAHFAAFHLICYFHSNNQMWERAPGDCGPCDDGSSNDKCVRGYFVDFRVPSMVGGCEDTGLVAPSFRRP